MAISVDENGIVMIEIHGLLYNQQTRTRFFYKHTGAGSVLTTDTLRTAFNAGVLGPLLACFSEDWEIEQSFYKVWSAIFAVQGDVAYTEGLAGAVGTESYPPSVALVVRKKTGLSGRAKRGRWYFPGLPMVTHDEGRVAAASRAAIEVCVDKLDDTLTAGTPAGNQLPVLAHFNSGGQLTGVDVVSSIFTDWILRSQRRREIGVGI